MWVIFCCKYIFEIRTGNPSLTVKILNITPRPILPRDIPEGHDDIFGLEVQHVHVGVHHILPVTHSQSALWIQSCFSFINFGFKIRIRYSKLIRNEKKMWVRIRQHFTAMSEGYREEGLVSNGVIAYPWRLFEYQLNPTSISHFSISIQMFFIPLFNLYTNFLYRFWSQNERIRFMGSKIHICIFLLLVRSDGLCFPFGMGQSPPGSLQSQSGPGGSHPDKLDSLVVNNERKDWDQNIVLNLLRLKKTREK